MSIIANQDFSGKGKACVDMNTNMKPPLFLRAIRSVLFKIVAAVHALAVRTNYSIVQKRIRKCASRKTINVLFMVNETTKWKAQSLYDLMEADAKYNPIMGITVADTDRNLSDVEQQDKMDRVAAFFEGRGMRTVRLYDARTKTVVNLGSLDVDVVFYQQPYVILDEHQPQIVSYSALTCYIPYYVPDYGSRHFDYEFEFYKNVWRYFILNKSFARAYHRFGWLEGYAGKILGLGHTCLDYYHLHGNAFSDENIVIYAPHWAFAHPKNENLENYSTFLWNGEAMLEYAKNHREFKWVFRPHPALSMALQRSGVWSEEKIAAYWHEWATIGTISKDDDYQELFMKSKALITDCGSFLTEYFATGKPLIHLISADAKIQPISITKPYFDSWYKVHDLAEMAEVFETVLERGEDPMREERLAVLQRAGLSDHYAAEKILVYLNHTLGLS